MKTYQFTPRRVARSLYRHLVPAPVKGFFDFLRWPAEDRRRVLREEAHFLPRLARDATRLWWARRRYSHLYADSQGDPLVSVIIPTYNRAELLIERAVKSALAQTYTHIEVIVVGDHCTDDTAERIAAIDDPRLIFYNLPTRGPYPEDRKLLWMVAGTYPYNRGLQIAQGQWICMLDDDELFTPDHIEVLLQTGRKRNAELIQGILRVERKPGVWTEGGQALYRAGRSRRQPGKFNKHSQSFYRAYIGHIFSADIDCYAVGWSGDQHFAWRMHRAGVRAEYVEQVMTVSPLRPDQTVGGWQAEDRPIPQQQQR